MAQTCCTRKKVVIKKAQLPFCCPQPAEDLFSGHPRVYLPLEKTGNFICPYCSTHYVLAE